MSVTIIPTLLLLHVVDVRQLNTCRLLQEKRRCVLLF